MSKTNDYRARLRALAAADWDDFLLRESGLPGPRANLELVQAVADEGGLEQFRRWITRDEEYLALCGAVGLGRVLADGADEVLVELRALAGDSRWRVREGVALGLQRLGARDMAHLLAVLRPWAEGNWLERRAVVAALCEPALVRDEAHARAVLQVLDLMTEDLVRADERKSAEFGVLRQALAYGWSVAIVGCPGLGKPLLEKWLACGDTDGEWLARENLTKGRLTRMDPEWVRRWASR